ncbi:MAG: DUF2142 domain-containing protein [Rouxiella badensis]|uniref:DUF2142 domain-containing protein n=1 Tax=Rouxiella badensis TaxID=1646377 RepID=UPI003C3E443F
MKRESKLLIFPLALLIIYSSFFLVFNKKPPLTSPDEVNHFSRSAALANGYFTLVGQPNSGGEIDNAIIEAGAAEKAIENSFNPQDFSNYVNKLQDLNFTGSNAFYAMPNVAYYFPAVYTPQAVTIAIAEKAGLTFYQTYFFASTVTFTVSLLIILLAWRIYPIPPLALATLILPMSLYQLFSPTIDGLSISFAILTMSIFMNLVKNPVSEKYNSLVTLMSIFIFFLAGSRANLLPFVLLPLWLFGLNKRKINLVWFVVTTVAVLGWTVFALKTTHNTVVTLHPGVEATDVIKYYISHPLEVIKVLVHTLTDAKLVATYFITFIGLLGVLDSTIRIEFTVIFAVFIIFMILKTFVKDRVVSEKWTAWFIILITIAAVFLIFLALLAQWSPFPAVEVAGVQGRYFLIPLAMLAYAFKFNYSNPKAYFWPLAIAFVLSVAAIYVSMADRYASNITESSRIIYHSQNRYFLW